MKNGKKHEKPSYFHLLHRIEDTVCTASWASVKMKPKGHMGLGTFYWPKKVQRRLKKLTNVVNRICDKTCGCSKKSKKRDNGDGCNRTRKRVVNAIKPFRLLKRHKLRITEAVALLAHTKRPG